jgi:hypothetical protein
MKVFQMGHAKGVEHTKATSISREVNLMAKFVEHAFEALQEELGTMHAILHEMELKCSVLHE